MDPSAPHNFHLSKAYKTRAHAPVAFVLPTTVEVKRTLSRLGIASVGNLQLGSHYSPTSILSSLKKQDERPMLVFFTDQVVDQANTSLMVRTSAGERYISPFEAILNSYYGYEIAFWTRRGFVDCQAGTGDLHRIAAMVVEHLDSAKELGSEWILSEYQVLRSQESRCFNAKRKLRMYRSAVINAFRDSPTSSEARRLIAKADELEKSVAAWSS